MTVKPNLNEIRDYKYVDKAELQAMFEAPGTWLFGRSRAAGANGIGGLTGNSFTPWFKLIARDFLFGWWDELLRRKSLSGTVDAKSLADLADDKVHKMV